MKTPPRQRTKLAGILAMLAVIALVTALVLPDPAPPRNEPAPRGDPHYVDTYNHPVSFRFLVPLAPSKSGRRVELETDLLFGYSVSREDTTDARESIKANFNKAARALAGMLRQRTQMEFVSDLESINEKALDILDAELFPDGDGQVQTVNWSEFKFR